MKKFIIASFVFLFSCISSYAVDLNKVKQLGVTTVSQVSGIDLNTNFKQQEAEKEWKEKTRTELMLFKSHCALIENDYLNYKYVDDISSTYGRILEFKKDTVYTLDMQYADKAQKLIDKIANLPNKDNFTPKHFAKLKIIIPDKDFDKIHPDLREIILFLNSY